MIAHDVIIHHCVLVTSRYVSDLLMLLLLLLLMEYTPSRHTVGLVRRSDLPGKVKSVVCSLYSLGRVSASVQ